ncbi:hypothetical protein QBC40DRAFT_97816 [Triangularia verruculosa]|uniref:DUF7580 domain-containing protein n=1 Tax=Triangularia verruculosa TaxID=2587418 RepID=A0AAN6XPE1_9PEZI|nr:hypothetical protein QBC40DRAFT_97816 [Triangularia verruculosa]
MAEVLGIVLGVIPLVISALEHYQDVVDPAVAFFQWRQQLPKVIRELYMAHTSYEQNLRLLLHHKAVDEEHLSEMIENPSSEHWKDSHLVSALQDKLGTAFEPCMSTINEIADLMLSISKCLNIEGTDIPRHQNRWERWRPSSLLPTQPKWDIANPVTLDATGALAAIIIANPPEPNEPKFRTRFHFRQRIEFTMNRKNANNLLKKLDKCNTRLYEFIEKANKLQGQTQAEAPPESKTRSKLKFVASLDCIRGNASKIHGAISSGWCTSHPTHLACLRLERRRGKKTPSRKSSSSAQEVGRKDCFGISLLKGSKLSWIDIELEVDEEDEDVQASSGQRTPTIKIVLPQASTRPTRQSQLPEVTDICYILESMAHPLLGFRLCARKLLGPFRVNTPAPRLSEKCITLQDFLPAIKHEDFPLPDLYLLAVTLVSSILQLSSTPWLRRGWSKQTIQFIRLRDNDAVDIKQPYLGHMQAGRGSVDPFPSNDSSPLVDRCNMLALGILLLEINSGMSIESMRQELNPESGGQENDMADLVTASQWLHKRVEAGRMTRQFSDAITYCLQCYLDHFVSLGNPDFSKAVEERVLEPLECEMQYLYGQK